MSLTVDIEKQIGKFHLKVAFQGEPGEMTGLLGASGCGKSMTLKCIAGVEQPDRGIITLDGVTLFDAQRRINLPPQKRKVGLLFQHYALFPHMTVAGNIAAGVPRGESRDQVCRELLTRFRLEEHRDKLPRQLSGGQQQRVALARILAARPRTLLLDEPFSALDSHLAWEIQQELEELSHRFPGPCVLVTHNQEEVRRLCSRVCVLDQGISQPVRSTADLFRRPTTLAACRLTGCRNISPALPRPDGTVTASGWGAVLAVAHPLPPQASHLAIHPHHLRPVHNPGQNRLRCQVGQVEERPFSRLVSLTPPAGGAPLLMEVDARDWLPFQGREEIWVELPPQHLLPLT